MSIDLTLRLSALLAGLTMMTPNECAAEFLPEGFETYEFQLKKPDTAPPLLVGNYSQLYGYSQYITGGSIYFTCNVGRSDHYRLNLILETNISDYFSESKMIFIGVRNFMSTEESVIGSKSTENIAFPPHEFAFSSYTQGFAKGVTPYDEYGTYENRQLYVESFPDASFFQKMKEGDRLALVAYENDTHRFGTIMELHYLLEEETAKEFVISCMKS